MVWLAVLFLLILVFGVGTVIEAAFWTIVLVALAVLLVGLLASGGLSRGRSA